MGLEININTFRKPKIVVNNDQILEIQSNLNSTLWKTKIFTEDQLKFIN